MARTASALAALALFCVPSPADEKKPAFPLNGSVGDAKLEKEKPAVVVSEKGWEKLTKAWGIKDAPKVDFTKNILIVGTTTGSRISLSHQLDDKGNLTVQGMATADIGPPGFRYAIQSVSREGVKTVNGKELPKE